MLTHKEQALQTHVQHKVPLLFGQVGHGLANGDARIIMQNVDASELLYNGRNCGGDALLAGDIALEKSRLPSGVPHLLRLFFRLVAHIHNGDCRAVGGQQLRHAQSNTRAAAGDDGHLPGQIQGIFLLQHHKFLLYLLNVSVWQFFCQYTSKKHANFQKAEKDVVFSAWARKSGLFSRKTSRYIGTQDGA